MWKVRVAVHGPLSRFSGPAYYEKTFRWRWLAMTYATWLYATLPGTSSDGRSYSEVKVRAA